MRNFSPIFKPIIIWIFAIMRLTLIKDGAFISFCAFHMNIKALGYYCEKAISAKKLLVRKKKYCEFSIFVISANGHYCELHLVRITFTANYIYCEIHLLRNTFTANYPYCEINIFISHICAFTAKALLVRIVLYCLI